MPHRFCTQYWPWLPSFWQVWLASSDLAPEWAGLLAWAPEAQPLVIEYQFPYEEGSLTKAPPVGFSMPAFCGLWQLMVGVAVGDGVFVGVGELVGVAAGLHPAETISSESVDQSKPELLEIA